MKFRLALRAIASVATTVLVAAVFVAMQSVPASAVDPLSAETWRALDIKLTATGTYSNPVTTVNVTATFTSPNQPTITRPAFWNGGTSWIVRFAAPAAGTWTMTTSSNVADTGLNAVTNTVQVTPYSGNLPIYQHGFLSTSADGHYLTYRDGTPFFYLGDTHWTVSHERWTVAPSTDPAAHGVSSPFQYEVDKRVSQGFSVYQTEAIWQPQGSGYQVKDDDPKTADVRDGQIQESDLAGFANLDQKFKYIADSGLVNASAMIGWVDDLNNVTSSADAAALGRYWAARYGAYPTIWTTGQELDANRYASRGSGGVNATGVAAWDAAISALASANSYNVPIMPHQEAISVDGASYRNASNSRFCPYPFTSCPAWFSGYAAQVNVADNWPVASLETYWASGRPALGYETLYDKMEAGGKGTDSRHALSAYIKAYLSGLRGYGYGINGIWNDIYTIDNFGTDYGKDADWTWWPAINDATAGKLQNVTNLLKSISWWKLTPRFGDVNWSDFGDGGNKILASDASSLYVALFADGTTGSGTLRQLSPGASYDARWVDPNTGISTTIGSFTAPSGSWTAPAKPGSNDYILVVTKTQPQPTVAPPSCNAAQGAVPAVDLTDTAASFFASSARAGQLPAFAFDNSYGSNWQPATDTFNNEYLGVDFGKTVTFSSIQISEYAQRTRSFVLEYYANGAWNTAYTSPAGFAGFGGTNAPSTITFPAVTGSQMRIRYLSGSEAAPIVYELLVIGANDLTIGATASSAQQSRPGQDPAKAIDKNTGTNWQPIEGSLNGTTLTVDWGSVKSFGYVTVSEYGNRSTKYTLQYSTDGNNWESICSGTGGFGATSSTTTRLTFAPVSGRMMRLVFDQVSAYSPIIYEMAVYAR